MVNERPVHYAVKLVFDRAAALLALVILFPVFILIGLLIKLDSSGPVFFAQNRVGKDGKLFKSIKFRTMVHRATETGLGLNIKLEDERITRVGQFLRTWSLDELPQFYSVLRGDMSIVGPRPTLLYQVEQYSDFQKKRLLVRPGITGWAQINGRNAIGWEERIKLDVWYVENWSLWLDLKIMLRTIRVIVKREGLYGASGINDDFLQDKQDSDPTGTSV
ncbi:MAG: sugar transferase [Proteobacteria bacterium]|nr:sugar transferase [Pseudomonadota bacterium]